MMFVLTKPFTAFPSQIPCFSRHPFTRSLVSIRSSSDNGNDLNTSPPVGLPITPPDAVEIRFKRGSRKRRRKEEQDAATNQISPSKQAKEWDSMTLSEKAIELYVGEKGILFWLNKFAYASIFIVIGGWIVFRFVGPALNLYQLDTPPTSPASLFKGG